MTVPAPTLVNGPMCEFLISHPSPMDTGPLMVLPSTRAPSPISTLPTTWLLESTCP